MADQYRALFTSGSEVLQPSSLSLQVSQQPEGLVFSMEASRTGTPSSTCLLPRVKVTCMDLSFLSKPSQSHEFSPSYPVMRKSFLKLWLYRSSSVSFQFSLRIVSYVGVLWMCLCWGGEPRILPFCHPDPSCLCYLLTDCLGCGSYHGLMLIQISFLLTIVENLSGMRNHFVLIKFSLTHRL